MNKVILAGRVVKDPVIFDNADGKTVAIRLAVRQNFINRRTNQVESDFIDLKGFIGKDKGLGIYAKIHGGDLLELEGSIRSGKFVKEGKDVYTQDIVIVPGTISFLEGTTARSEREANKNAPAPEETAVPQIA